MRLRTRVWLLVGAALALIALLGATLFVLYGQARRSVDRIVDTLGAAGVAVADLTTDINNMDRRLRIYASKGDPGFRVLYDAASASAQRKVDELNELLGSEREFQAYVTEVDASLTRWLADVGAPARAAMRDGEDSAAQSILDSARSQSDYVQLTADTFRLSSLLAGAEQDALASGASAARRLAWAGFVALIVLLLIPLVGLWVLNRGVLGPLEHLRAQMRRTARAGEHNSVITPIGPPELVEVGADAEALRRALVHEIDQSEAARTALEQEGPVVDAIRRELAARTDPGPPGVHVAGVLRPAEGMLAGDFWDRIPLPDGRMSALVCDVSGHGPRAGIVAMRLKTAITLGLIAGQDLPQILHRSCDAFADEPARFATLAILVADPRSGELEWVNAGHPEPRIVRSTGEVERLAPTGPMVSWLVGTWRVGRTALGPRDTVLAFTDGILESRNAAGDELGDDELDQRLRQAAQANPEPQELSAQILAWVRERSADLGRDDVTLVSLRTEPSQDGQIPVQRH